MVIQCDQVWDGTKCKHPLLNVAVASDALEGESTIVKDRMNLTANVLVYDNHLEMARELKVSFAVDLTGVPYKRCPILLVESHTPARVWLQPELNTLEPTNQY